MLFLFKQAKGLLAVWNGYASAFSPFTCFIKGDASWEFQLVA
jgi:hypothetical protein